MKREVIELSSVPESLRKRIKQKLNMHDGSGELLQIIQTDHAYTAYLNAGNLCTILTVWNFDLEEVNEDSMTIGEMKVFMDHPIMKVWFSE